MKTAFIIHGFNGDTTYTFGPSLKLFLEELGYKVFMPNFPIRSEATFLGWSKVLDEYKNYFTEETMVICHSIGNPFFIQYAYNNNLKPKLYISVSGFCKLFSVPERDDLNNAFIDFKIDNFHTNYIKENIKYKYSLYGGKDHVIPSEFLKDFITSINSEPVFIPEVGHMGKYDNVTRLPQIEEILKKLSKEL